MSSDTMTPGNGCLTFTATLSGSPYAGDLTASEPVPMMLLGEGDYLAAKRYETDGREPVYVSYLQHYALLDDLVDRVATALPEVTHVLIRFHTVYIRPLPARLLSGRVLLVDDPDAMAAVLARSGVTDILVINDRIRRDSTERGDNTVTVTLHSGTPDQARFEQYIRACAIHRSCVAA